MIFLTFNDTPNGIYKSQVIDVVNLLSKMESITLVAFVSWRLLKSAKREIKKEIPNAKVYPIIGGLRRWKWNSFILKKFSKKNHCIARGPLACSIALDRGFKSVCYDGRAAVKAEIEEFDIVGDLFLSNQFILAEKRAVLESDYRIAVSDSLVSYWKSEFNYRDKTHVVIPCTLSQGFEDVDEGKRQDFSKSLGIKNDDVVFAFSGGSAGWNSLERTFNLFEPFLKKNSNFKMILLTKELEYIAEFKNKFPNQVFVLWVNHTEVKNCLAIADYGLLIREDKVTNNVASPVKFAEYLSLGMNVLISSNIKDYVSFIEEHQCGVVVNDDLPKFDKLNIENRSRNIQLAKNLLSKDSEIIRAKYEQLLIELKHESPHNL